MLSGTPWAANPMLATRRSSAEMRAMARVHAGGDAVEVGRAASFAPPDLTSSSVAGGGAAAVGEPTALAVEVLWREEWGDTELRRLGDHLGGGRLLFLEPTAALGWRRVAQRLAASLLRRLTGVDHDRDVPAALRQAGFLITNLDRFHVDRAGVQAYVYGEAIVKRR